MAEAATDTDTGQNQAGGHGGYQNKPREKIKVSDRAEEQKQ